MMVDYKISEERYQYGQLVYQKVRFYEGDITTEPEPNPNIPGEVVDVTRYRRSALLEEVEYTYDN